ncbi:AI-2E family transporter [Acidithiobacillus sp.]|uniref:AI-2E family transporter n=1 Tax=Acidithiobacillus sp. TaxID=1872118 RepID=UPI003D045CCC
MRLADLTVGDLQRWLGLFLAAAVLLWLAWLVLAPFLSALVWAAILVYATWPLRARLTRLPPVLMATLMTVLLGLIFVLPVLFLATTLGSELRHTLSALAGLLRDWPWQQKLAQWPWLAQPVDAWLGRLRSGLAAGPDLGAWAQRLGVLAGGIGRAAAVALLTLVSAFFLYRHGELLVAHFRLLAVSVIGQRADAYLGAVGSTIRAVIYGILATALAQGTLAGIGYAVAGLPAPILLAVITLLFSFIPFGTPIVWGSAGIWLLLQGQTAAGVGLLLWGALVVSWIDNLIRPLVIASAIHIPFLLVLFGVLGGILAFGFLGIFVGPIILAVLLAVWAEWLSHARARQGP